MPIQTRRFIRNPFGFLERCSQRYGSVVAVRLFGFGTTVWVTEPNHIGDVLRNDKALPLSPAGNLVKPIFGTNSVTGLDWEEHLHRRRQLLPHFGSSVLNGYEEAFVDATEREMSRWSTGEIVELHPAMYRITLDVMIRALMGVPDARRRARIADALLAVMAKLDFLALGDWIRRDLGPWSPWARFLALRRELDDLLYREIDIHRLAGRDDILQQLLHATHEDGTPLTDEDLRNELVTLLVAGSETTATSLAWAFDLLMHNRAYIEPIVDEAVSGAGDVTDLVSLEALRMRPPVIAAGRIAVEPVNVGGFELKPGTRVWASAYLAHHRPESFERPNEFDPERHRDRQGDGNCWIPFGGGVRRCLGAPFALREMRLVLQTVLSNSQLTAADDTVAKSRAHGAIMVPANGAPVRVDSLRVLTERARSGGRFDPTPPATRTTPG